MMINNGLTPIVLLLIVCNAITAIDVGNALFNFENDFIHGIDLYETNVLGVALDKRVYVGQIQDDKIIELVQIPLDEHTDANNNSSLLEFKLINKSRAFTCTSSGCSVCSSRVDSTSKCYKIFLHHGKLASASAAFVNNDIVLRTVSATGGAAIRFFLSEDSNYKESGQISKDASIQSDFETVTAFSTPTHSYFVGSAKRRDLVTFPLKQLKTRNNTDIRITRICNNDKTANLASRIDLVLSCEGIDYKQIEKTVTNKATAALYLPETSKLLIAFQHGDVSLDENFICSYNFTDLQQRFAETWNNCQIGEKCHILSSYAKLNNSCFLFSWDNLSNQPYCSPYNDASGEDQFDNCKLHTSKSSLKAYGSLENFKPYDGKLLFKEKHIEPIVAVREISNEGALYALRKNKQVIRLIGDKETSEVLTTIPGKPGKQLLEVLPKTNKILFVPARSEATVNFFTSSCEEIYKTCESIAWNDPLHCLYCANEDGSGSVIHDKTNCPDNVIYDGVCPPIISETTKTGIGNGSYYITGYNLDKFTKEPEVTVCDIRCNLTTPVAPTIIRCSTGISQNNDCVVKITGSLNLIYTNITLSKSLQSDYSDTSNISDNSKSKRESTILRATFFVVALVVLLASICLIYKRISKHNATQHRISGQLYHQVKSDIYLKPMSDELNPNDLVVKRTQKLGNGFSASVYKGSYKTSSCTYEDVAVKVLQNDYGVNPKLYDELRVLSRVQHANIVVFIGYVTIDHTLNIVTEYMAGGSLYDYIRNESTLLKYQHTFDYMDQILSAMVYLGQQKIVHRDLAARNCLLNYDYTILKVTDFGLSRTADFQGEYQFTHKGTRLPLRWLGIEAFTLQKMTEKSDVWSFGVLTYELFTRGELPYEHLDTDQVSIFLSTGQRLPCPDTCPELIYAVMLNCWDAEPDKRPNFRELQKQVRDVVNRIVNANKQLVDTEYERPRSQTLTPNGSKSVTVV